jgi:polyisoprenoid-binding protein YceI
MNGASIHRIKKTAQLSTLAALVISAMLVSTSSASAAAEAFVIDPAHSSVGFSISHLFSKVRGSFDEFDGTIVIDREDWSKSTVTVNIVTASINTREEARDKHLRSEDFFDAENHPKITFVSDGARKKGKNKLTVRGNLTMRGITKRVLLNVEILGFAEYYSVERAGFEAKTTVDRHDFEISWNDDLDNGDLVLGEEVFITLNIEAKKQKPKKASK